MSYMSCPALIYQNARIVKQGPSIYFMSDDYPLVCNFYRSCSRDELGTHIHGLLQLSASQRISKIVYRMPIGNTAGGMVATALKIQTDVDVEKMFNAYDMSSAYFQYIEVMVEVVETNSGGEYCGAGHLGHSGAGPSTAELPAITHVQGEASSRQQMMYTDHQEPLLHHHATNEETVAADSYRNATNEIFTTRVQADDIADDEALEDEEDDVNYAPSLNDESDNEDLNIRTSHGQLRREHSTMPFMSRLNLREEPAEAHDDNVPYYNPKDPNSEIVIGMTFADKESLVVALKHYCIRRNVDFLVKDSEGHKYAGVCKMKSSGCKWKVRARLGKKDNLWKITRYEGPHTCNTASMTVDHRKLDSDFICSIILRTIADNPATTIAQIISDVDQRYQYQPSYRKAWVAKQKTITKLFGDWEASYNQLPRWILAMKEVMPGTVVDIEVNTAYFPNGTVCDSFMYFGRVFWAFPPCIQAFPYCKPIVQVDGTHLFGRYKGTLLVAVTQDGNNNVLPLAFAHVESENDSSWQFFLKNLRQHVCVQDNLCIISDRHDSIRKALIDIEWVPQHAVHRYCIRHFASNYHKSFKDIQLRKAVTNAGYATAKKDFLHWYGIAAGEPERKTWLDRVPLEKWTQFYDGNHRYGQMTTNLVECINNVLKGTRHLPITALVKSTYYRLTELFDRRGVDADTQAVSGFLWSQHLIKVMANNQKLARHIRVQLSSRRTQEFLTVQYLPSTSGGSQKQLTVNLHNWTCSCGMFQIHRYPCEHAYAAITSQNLDWGAYVADVYKIENLKSAYAMDFPHIGSEDSWPAYYGPNLIPNPATKRTEKGRPKTLRIRTEMDLQEQSQTKRCGLCRQEGHFRNTCPNKERYLKK